MPETEGQSAMMTLGEPRSMRTWTDTTFNLPDGRTMFLCVTPHDRCVSLHIPGYALEGQGFSINFTDAHLPVVEELLQGLQRLKDRKTVQGMQQEHAGQEAETQGPEKEPWHMLGRAGRKAIP